MGRGHVLTSPLISLSELGVLPSIIQATKSMAASQGMGVACGAPPKSKHSVHLSSRCPRSLGSNLGCCDGKLVLFPLHGLKLLSETHSPAHESDVNLHPQTADHRCGAAGHVGPPGGPLGTHVTVVNSNTFRPLSVPGGSVPWDLIVAAALFPKSRTLG